MFNISTNKQYVQHLNILENIKTYIRKNIRKPFTYVVNLGGYVDHTNRKKVFKSHYIGCKNLAEIFLKKTPKPCVFHVTWTVKKI